MAIDRSPSSASNFHPRRKPSIFLINSERKDFPDNHRGKNLEKKIERFRRRSRRISIAWRENTGSEGRGCTSFNGGGNRRCGGRRDAVGALPEREEGSAADQGRDRAAWEARELHCRRRIGLAGAVELDQERYHSDPVALRRDGPPLALHCRQVPARSLEEVHLSSFDDLYFWRCCCRALIWFSLSLIWSIPRKLSLLLCSWQAWNLLVLSCFLYLSFPDLINIFISLVRIMIQWYRIYVWNPSFGIYVQCPDLVEPVAECIYKLIRVIWNKDLLDVTYARQ